MTTLHAFTTGFRKVSRNKRLIFFVWFINTAIAMIVAIPLLNQLDAYIAPTVNEEQLLRHWDDNWYRTYRADFEKSNVASLLSYSVLGYAPFATGLNNILNGTAIRPVAGFFLDLFTSFQVRTGSLSIVLILLFVYTLLNTYFAGGFIGAFREDASATLKDFLADGATYFGRFFRLFIVSLILFYLLTVVTSSINQSIASGTANSPSELTPFIWYMVRDVVFFLLLALMIMWFDYAKIGLVVNGRWSALGAFGTGVKFSFVHFSKTFPLVLVLSLCGLLLMAAYALFESLFPQTGYWSILLIVVLEQLYIFFRVWIRAAYYGSQTVMFQELSADDYTASMGPVATSAS